MDMGARILATIVGLAVALLAVWHVRRGLAESVGTSPERPRRFGLTLRRLSAGVAYSVAGTLVLGLVWMAPVRGAIRSLGDPRTISGLDVIAPAITSPTVEWATIVRHDPDPNIIKDPAIRDRIVAVGAPWLIRDVRTGIEFVLIPPGEFLMGSPASEEGHGPAEEPQHRVSLTRAFYLARTEVTNTQYRSQNPAHQSGERFDGPDQPVVNVSWDEASEYCAKLGYRLPTEAEWEYSARAGTQSRFWSGDRDADLAAVGWYSENSQRVSNAVAQKGSNPLGLFDVHGNVWEWCRDRWESDYRSRSAGVVDPEGPSDGGSGRVIRGGGWVSIAWFCRSANRYGDSPGDRYDYLGFRPARTHGF